MADAAKKHPGMKTTGSYMGFTWDATGINERNGQLNPDSVVLSRNGRPLYRVDFDDAGKAHAFEYRDDNWTTSKEIDDKLAAWLPLLTEQFTPAARKALDDAPKTGPAAAPNGPISVEDAFNRMPSAEELAKLVDKNPQLREFLDRNVSGGISDFCKFLVEAKDHYLAAEKSMQERVNQRRWNHIQVDSMRMITEQNTFREIWGRMDPALGAEFFKYVDQARAAIAAENGPKPGEAPRPRVELSFRNRPVDYEISQHGAAVELTLVPGQNFDQRFMDPPQRITIGNGKVIVTFGDGKPHELTPGEAAQFFKRDGSGPIADTPGFVADLQARGVSVSGVEPPREAPRPAKAPDRLPEPEKRQPKVYTYSDPVLRERWDRLLATESARNHPPPPRDAPPQPGLVQMIGNVVAGVVGLVDPEAGNKIRDDASKFRLPNYRSPGANPFT